MHLAFGKMVLHFLKTIHYYSCSHWPRKVFLIECFPILEAKSFYFLGSLTNLVHKLSIA